MTNSFVAHNEAAGLNKKTLAVSPSTIGNLMIFSTMVTADGGPQPALRRHTGVSRNFLLVRNTVVLPIQEGGTAFDRGMGRPRSGRCTP